MEIRWVIEKQEEILSDIEESEEKVRMKVEAVIGNFQSENEFDLNIKKLISVLEEDESKAYLNRIVGVGVGVAGVLLSMTNPLVAGGAFIGAGAIAGVHNFYKNQLDKQEGAQNYKVVILKLETVILPFPIFNIKNFNTAITFSTAHILYIVKND